jgi:lipoprotein-anchoring transpeptidase ErfK/SrfK
MRCVFVSALLVSVAAAPAFADPITITPEAYALSQGGSAMAAPAGQGADSAGQRHYADASGSNLGGGFIEFLFGGAASQQPSQRGYQPAVAPQNSATTDQPQPAFSPAQNDATQQASTSQGYAPSSDGDMAHPQIDPKFERQVVDYDGHEAPGTIIVDTPNKFLFLVEDNGKAMRYGIGVGRPGFTWAGVKSVTSKREWPDWYPPSEMIQRRPDLPRYMAGGPENPLGARALYLGSTLYRIHGSNEPWTIGTNVSSGCIRMRNADVIDLYQRVKVGTRVVVI